MEKSEGHCCTECFLWRSSGPEKMGLVRFLETHVCLCPFHDIFHRGKAGKDWERAVKCVETGERFNSPVTVAKRLQTTLTMVHSALYTHAATPDGSHWQFDDSASSSPG
eukprot:g26039.t1